MMKSYIEAKLGAQSNDVIIISEPIDEKIDADFAVYKENEKTVIYAPIASFFESAFDKYISDGDFGREASYTTDKIYYSDFGAVGDGKEEDVDALRRAHVYANLARRHTVCARAGEKFYIEKTGCSPIRIQTDCNWEGAEFIVDDRFIDEEEPTRLERLSAVFVVTTEYTVTYTKENDPLGIIARLNDRGGISTDDTTLPLNLGFDALICPINTEKSMYMRWSPNGTSGKGKPQQEVILVRADNSIDLSTRPLFPYAGVDQLIIARCDNPTITLKGGRFTTIATRCDMHWNGVNRSFRITRSNVIIDGMDHYVENQPLGEPIKKLLSGYEVPIPVTSCGGPNYFQGWIYTYMAHNIVIQNSKFCGRAHYNNGSYDLGGSLTNKTVFKNCNQYNMYDENGELYHENYAYWGIHGTNYCKNIEFIDCEFFRFDAHAGVYNVLISGCTLAKINTNGGGTLIVENSTIYSPALIGLREDYATSWRGDVIFRNVVFDRRGNANYGWTSCLRLVGGNIHNADYGFNTQIPNVIVDNVTWTEACGTNEVYVYGLGRDESFYNPDAPKKNEILPAERVIIRNQKPGFEITAVSHNDSKDLVKELIYE